MAVCLIQEASADGRPHSPSGQITLCWLGKMKCSFITISALFRSRFQTVYHFPIENSDFPIGAIIIQHSSYRGFLSRFSTVYNYWRHFCGNLSQIRIFWKKLQNWYSLNSSAVTVSLPLLPRRLTSRHLPFSLQNRAFPMILARLQQNTRLAKSFSYYLTIANNWYFIGFFSLQNRILRLKKAASPPSSIPSFQV